MLEFENPVCPEAYDDTALPANLTAAEKEQRRRKQETERAEELAQFDVWQAYETWAKEQLEEAYEESYLEALKDDLLGFTHVHVNQMLTHLTEQCLALTTGDKKKKLKQIELEWTPGDDIRVFFSKVQKLKDELEDEYGIDWTDDLRMTHVVSELTDSNIFTEEEMMNWEDLPKEEQTYVRMLSNFTKLFDKHARFGNKLSPNAHGFESANQLTFLEGNKEEVLQLLMQLLANQKEVAEAATADKEHLQQMTTSNEDLIVIIKKTKHSN